MLPSCLSKKSDDASPSQRAELEKGTWNWQQSTGGFIGATTTPASTGKQQSIIFNGGMVRHFVNGQLTRTDTYTIQRGDCIHTGQPADLIIYGSGQRDHFTVSGDELGLANEVYDGFGHSYHR
ncbi:hypothetical protein B0919_10990 [Hymenobacter sp. CRA2]|nr:hypothetical protein B0919_10990 [Hymenobacter sp. CRA2]